MLGEAGQNQGSKGAMRSSGNTSLRMANANKGPKVLKPEEIIPFDDKEGFKDF
jgi:hypothetical protein